MANTTIKSYIDAGVQFTEMSKKQAEALVKSLVKSGEVRRKDAEQVVQSLVARSKESTDRLSAAVQAEVAKQMKAFSARFDELEGLVESLASSVGVTKPDSGAAAQPAAEPPAKKAPAKKAPARRKAAKKKAAVKTAPVRKQSSAEPVGSSGVRKVSTTRPE